MSDPTVDFNSILDTQVDEIVSKPPLPVGQYKFRIKAMEPVTSSQKKTPGIRFTIVPFEIIGDVDQELLTAAGGLGEREMRLDFWITPDAASVCKDFLVNHVGLEGTGRTMRQLLAECVNQQVGGIISHGLTKDGRQFAQVNQTFKIEE